MFTESDVLLNKYDDPFPGKSHGYVERILNKLGSPQRICKQHAQSHCV